MGRLFVTCTGQERIVCIGNLHTERVTPLKKLPRRKWRFAEVLQPLSDIAAKLLPLSYRTDSAVLGAEDTAAHWTSARKDVKPTHLHADQQPNTDNARTVAIRELATHRNKIRIVKAIFRSPVRNAEVFFRQMDKIMIFLCTVAYALWVLVMRFIVMRSSSYSIDALRSVPRASNKSLRAAVSHGIKVFIGWPFGTCEERLSLTVGESAVHALLFSLHVTSMCGLLWMSVHVGVYGGFIRLVLFSVFVAASSAIFSYELNTASAQGLSEIFYRPGWSSTRRPVDLSCSDLSRGGDSFTPQDGMKLSPSTTSDVPTPSTPVEFLSGDQCENYFGLDAFGDELSKAKRASESAVFRTLLAIGCSALLVVLVEPVWRLSSLLYGEFYMTQSVYTLYRTRFPVAVALEFAELAIEWRYFLHSLTPFYIAIILMERRLRVARELKRLHPHVRSDVDHRGYIYFLKGRIAVLRALNAEWRVIERVLSRIVGMATVFALIFFSTSTTIIAALRVLVTISCCVILVSWTVVRASICFSIMQGQLRHEIYDLLSDESATAQCVAESLLGSTAADVHIFHPPKVRNHLCCV
eukprot:Lankesteria_metandrocarpae@DN2669_c0_g1_i2.p1